MSGTYGKVYERRKNRMAAASARAQKNRENALARRRMLSATGTSSMKELYDVAFNQPGVSPRVRPSLQVASFLWTNNKAPQEINPGGSTFLFTSYPFGSADFQRHTNETLTYKMSMMTQFSVKANYYGTCANFGAYWWLVYDKSPTGQTPTPAAIFDTTYDTLPVTWTVSRDVCHRFVVKKKGKVSLSTNGLDPSLQLSQYQLKNAVPAKTRVDVSRFYKRLGVRTEWKNTTDGGIGDIKSGALYLVIAPSNGFVLCVSGRFRLYFKSVGNQ